MIIIIEGPRGAGKSTICSQVKAIVERLGIRINVLHPARDADPILAMIKFVHFIRDRGEPRTIYLVDRFHLTELTMRAFELQETDLSQLDKSNEVAQLVAQASKVAIEIDSVPSLVFLIVSNRNRLLMRVARRMRESRAAKLPEKRPDGSEFPDIWVRFAEGLVRNGRHKDNLFVVNNSEDGDFKGTHMLDATLDIVDIVRERFSAWPVSVAMKAAGTVPRMTIELPETALKTALIASDVIERKLLDLSEKL